MATEPTPEDGVTTLVGRLSEMSHLTTLTTLDALIAAATSDARPAASAQLAKTLADRVAQSTAELQDTLGLR